jgi:hypothetical protein
MALIESWSNPPQGSMSVMAMTTVRDASSGSGGHHVVNASHRCRELLGMA